MRLGHALTCATTLQGLEADSTEEDSEQYNDGEAENENMAAEDGSEEVRIQVLQTMHSCPPSGVFNTCSPQSICRRSNMHP